MDSELWSSEAGLGLEDRLPRWFTHMLGKLVPVVGRGLTFSPCRSLQRFAQVSSWHVSWLLHKVSALRDVRDLSLEVRHLYFHYFLW